jgi:hypothetical protein
MSLTVTLNGRTITVPERAVQTVVSGGTTVTLGGIPAAPPSGSTWILTGGTWSDAGEWIDTESWSD